jgi:NitT/TauT family transport system substrate-binding protein
LQGSKPPYQNAYPCQLPNGDYLELPFLPLPPDFETAIAFLCSNQTSFAVEDRLTTLMANMEGKRVLLVEDVISTGGTISAELELMKKIGANVVGISTAVTLRSLRGVFPMFKFPAKRLIGLALVALLFTVACSAQKDANAPEPSALVAGVNPWPGYAGHYVAMKKEFFKQEGVNVQEAFFQSATEGITAFLANKLDLAWVTSGDAIQIIAKDPTAKIFYLVDYSNGSDGIMGRDIKDPKDLKGKTIGRENLLFEEVLLRAYLAKGGLTAKDITIKDMTAADAATAFASKKVDAAVSYEPWLTKAAKQGGGKVIFSTKNTNLISDVLITRQKAIETRKKELQGYLKAVDKAVKLVNAGDAEAIKIVGDKLGAKPDEAKEQIAGVTIFDLAGNKSIGFNLSNANNMMKNLELTAKTAVETKLMPKLLETKSLYDDSIVNSL